MRGMPVASCCELRSLRVTASYLSPGVSPTFVTIIASLLQNLVLHPGYGHFLLLTHIFSGCRYFMDRGSMNQGSVDHGS